MLKLTQGGRMMSGEDAVEFFEMLPDSIPDEIKTFEYEWALNRLRVLARGDLPREPHLHFGTDSRGDYQECPQCGNVLAGPRKNYCAECGQRLDWSQVTEKYIESRQRG